MQRARAEPAGVAGAGRRGRDHHGPSAHGDLFESESRGQERLPADRRCNTDLDLEVRTKGFAIVPGAAMTPRPREEPDAEDRARFENILSFRRRREPRPGRAVGAASTVMEIGRASCRERVY